MSLQHFKKLGEIITSEFKNRERYYYRDFDGIPGYKTAINALLIGEGIWNALKYDGKETKRRANVRANQIALNAIFVLGLLEQYFRPQESEGFDKQIPIQVELAPTDPSDSRVRESYEAYRTRFGLRDMDFQMRLYD